MTERIFLFLPLLFYYGVIKAQNAFLSCPDDNHPHIIDLGLSSGTKWACCNIGAETPSDYGGFFAWGETEEKDVYSWDTYKYCNGKYWGCYDLGQLISGTEYDAADTSWGCEWVMPSLEQLEELIDECSYTKLNFLGIDIGIFQGPSGGYIAIPYSGYKINSSWGYEGVFGSCWSGTQDSHDTCDAWNMMIDSEDAELYHNYSRCGGQPIRPVYNSSNSINKIDVQSNSVQTIYNIYGVKVTNVKDFKHLPSGVYIVNGKKRYVK
jgi:hypothetical protein